MVLHEPTHAQHSLVSGGQLLVSHVGHKRNQQAAGAFTVFPLPYSVVLFHFFLVMVALAVVDSG